MENYNDMYAPQQPEQSGGDAPFPDPAAPAVPPEQPPAQQGMIPMPGSAVSSIPQQIRQSQEFPGSPVSTANPVQPAQEQQPAVPGNQPQESAFYGDPNAPVGGTLFYPPPRLEMPPPPPVEDPPMNRGIYRMVVIGTILIFLLCIYCIAADILQGALGIEVESNSGSAEVVIQMQKKPELDPDDENVTEDGEYTVRGVAEVVTPSIVEVYVYSSGEQDPENIAGTGSGIIITEDGYIITNAHVVQGECFMVITNDEREYEATLIGSDTKTDLAVLKIEAAGLTPAVLGDSDEVYVGENVVAIGNPAGLTNTVTKGIVSAINRQVRAESTAFIMDCIQTDAAISPGNSGGALVNMYGQVVGITSSKYASSYMYTGSYEGLGFAITINQALPIVEELISQGYVSGRFRIGITFQEAGSEYAKFSFEELYGKEMPAGLGGLWISEISEDCDIAETELQPNDFILRMNGTEVSNYDDVIAVLDGFKGGDTVTADCARVEEDGTVSYFTIEFELETDTSGNY